MKPLILLGTLLPTVASAQITAERAKCEYSNLTTDTFVTAPCTIRWQTDRAIIQMGQRRFVIVEVGRQGQWSTVTINGKTGARYEIDRQTYSYATTDLHEFIDVSH